MVNNSLPISAPEQKFRPRLLVTRRLTPAVMARAERDYAAVFNPDDQIWQGDELLRRLAGMDAALICLTEKFPSAVIAALPPEVKILSTVSVGTDHIDVSAARARGLVVGNTPHGVTIATAEIALLLILGCCRRAPEGEALIRTKAWTGWEPTQLLGRRLDGKVLGIYGMGKIGQALAKRARAFDMVIHYANRKRLSLDDEMGAVYHDSLESLMAAADVLSVNAPSTPETRHAIRADTLAHAKPGMILVNTARGDLVRDADLIAALQSGQLAYAGLDVYQGEPNIHPGYLDLPNVFLLPHLGSATVEARDQMGFEALDNIDAYFAGQQLPFPVT
jgi:lactate dehydrogenase-like 2-hydroxyacid dehydrogenase